ncbi:MAG TPA: tail fiber protein, partial [Microthrixaceae bacterium]|nr:tail fiber protein [Microthrixaceae bacterium]
MTALSLPYNIANNTVADAVEVEQNFNALEDYVNNSTVRSDGVVAMTGQLQLVGDPVSDNDAARKAYVDNIIPIGVMMPYGGTAAPSSGQWALCNGAALSTATYPDLFAVLGYKFGGGGGSFSLPNTSGMFMVGVSGVSPTATIGVTGGSNDATVVAHVHGLAGHQHSLANHTHQEPEHTHNDTHGHSDTFAVSTGGDQVHDLKAILTTGGFPTSGSAGLRFGAPTLDSGDLSRLPNASGLWTP